MTRHSSVKAQSSESTAGTRGDGVSVSMPSRKTFYGKNASDSPPASCSCPWDEFEGEMWRNVPLSDFPESAIDAAASKPPVQPAFDEVSSSRQHLPGPAPLPLLSPAQGIEPATSGSRESCLSEAPNRDEIEEVDCTRRGCAKECSTSASGTDDWAPSSSGRGRKANKGGSWTVQGMIGAARTLCRWLYGLRRALSLAAAGASAELVLSSSCTGAGSFLLSLLRRSPLLLSTLMPMMSYLSSGPTSESALLCSTAVVLLTVSPCVSGGSAALQHILEAGAHAVHSTVSCCSRFLDVNSKSLQSSAHMVSMLAASIRKPRAASGSGSHLNLLAAVDLGLTTAAFLHMMISSSVRWCRGSLATEVLDEMPDDVQELGYMAKIMYDRELPTVVIFGGRRLCLLRNMTDSVMAVYASEDLLDTKQQLQQQQQGHVVVCHRGTWSPRDLIDDAHLLWGTFRSSPRYVDARARKQTLLDLWPGAKYTHVGHSLGGTVAMALVERMGDSVDAEAHAFNPGVSFEGFASPRSTIHLIAKDPVTFFAAAHPCSDCRIYPAHRNVHYMPLWAHQHSVYNFVAPPLEQPRIKAAPEAASVPGQEPPLLQ